MGRAPCCDKASVKKGPWSPEEDAKLKGFVEKFGTGGNWIALPQKAGLKRCGKSCRLRWLNYLRPNIRHGEFSDDEDRIICSLYASIGSRWSVIAAQLPGRTDNDIKNYWNTKLKKKLLTMIPSLPFQPSSLPSFDHHTSHQFVNTSSLFYAFTPNFLNLDNTSNSLFVHDDHSNVTNLHSPPPQAHAQPPVNNLMNNNNNHDLNDNFYNHLGIQDDQHNMCNTSPMLMFGSTASSSSESGSCMSQISHGNYNKDHGLKEKYQIKQKDYQITLHDQVLGDQIPSQSFTIKNHVSPMQNDLDDVKQTNYLFHDGQKGTCSYYY